MKKMKLMKMKVEIDIPNNLIHNHLQVEIAQYRKIRQCLETQTNHPQDLGEYTHQMVTISKKKHNKKDHFN